MQYQFSLTQERTNLFVLYRAGFTLAKTTTTEAAAQAKTNARTNKQEEDYTKDKTRTLIHVHKGCLFTVNYYTQTTTTGGD